jgi:hypothetical protein
MNWTKRFTNVGTLFLVVSLPAMTPSAEAGGRVGFTVTPKGEQVEVIQTGLALYSLTRSWRKKNRARVDQQGSGNGAAIAQHGQNNWAGVFQRGQGNSGSISQNGDNNAFALFQFGKKGNTAVTQNGDGNVGLSFEGGW